MPFMLVLLTTVSRVDAGCLHLQPWLSQLGMDFALVPDRMSFSLTCSILMFIDMHADCRA